MLTASPVEYRPLPVWGGLAVGSCVSREGVGVRACLGRDSGTVDRSVKKKDENVRTWGQQNRVLSRAMRNTIAKMKHKNS